MTYRQPAFMTDNAVAAITDVADITAGAGTLILTADKRALIDGRQNSLGTVYTTLQPGKVWLDLQTTPPASYDTMIIPAGHILLGRSITLFSNTILGFTGGVNHGIAVAPADDVVIERDLSSNAVRQFFLFQLNDNSPASTDTYMLGGFWIGEKYQLSSAAAVNPRFVSGWLPQIVEQQFPGGRAVAQLAPPLRTFTLRVHDVDPASADGIALDALMQQRTRSFWYWPPDDETPGPYLVRHRRDPERVQDFATPSVAVRYRYDFSFVEDRL